MTTNAFIRVHDLVHEYDGTVTALAGVELSIEEKDFLALVGANGSGKTTLVKHLNGLLKPTRGKVVVDGLDTRRTQVSRLARTVGFVFQNPDHQLFAHSVWEETVFGMKQLRLPGAEMENRARSALAAVDLLELRDRHPRELSRGQRQRLATASVLAIEPKILVLDEPTTGQDFRARRQIMDLAATLHAQGRIIIIVTHDMSIVAEYCSRVVVMHSGGILLDTTPRDLFQRHEILDRASLKPPPVVELAGRFRAFGFESDALTLSELETELIRAIKKPSAGVGD